MALNELLIESGAGWIIRVSVAGTLPPPASAAVIWTLDVPTTAGTPLIIPVVAFKLRPEGRPVAVNEVGEFVPAIW